MNVFSAQGYFAGHSCKSNFDVQFKMEFREDNLANALQFVTALGIPLMIVARVNDEEEKIKLGKFYVYSVKVDKNANCTVVFKSTKDSCFVGNFERLLVDEAYITLKAKVCK